MNECCAQSLLFHSLCRFTAINFRLVSEWTCVGSRQKAWWNKWFEKKYIYTKILLVGSVNASACMWPTVSVSTESSRADSWWYKMTLTCLGFCCAPLLLKFTSPLRDACHPGIAGRWGCPPAHRSGTFAPGTGPCCPAEGQRCCDSTGSRWFPAARAHKQRWPAGRAAGLSLLIKQEVLSNFI